jgi:hypothetical protein
LGKTLCISSRRSGAIKVEISPGPQHISNPGPVPTRDAAVNFLSCQLCE